MRMIGGYPFECTKCAKCCKWEGYIYMDSADCKKLAEHLRLTLNAFLNRYTEDKGGTVVLKRKEPGNTCIFLENNLCKVNDNKPNQCEKYPVKYEPRCPGFRVEKEGSMSANFLEAVKQVNARLTDAQDFVKSVTDNLYKDLQVGVKTASVAQKALSDGIDSYFDPNRVKVASLDDLFAFERVDKSNLIHKATHDLWSIHMDINGDVNITRQFNDNGEPIKG